MPRLSITPYNFVHDVLLIDADNQWVGQKAVSWGYMQSPPPYAVRAGYAAGFINQVGGEPNFDTQKAMMNVAVDLWDEVIKIRFAFQSDNKQTIAIANSSSINDKTAFTISGYTRPADKQSLGDIWFSTRGHEAGSAVFDLQNPIIGLQSFSTLLHEFGHAIGLSHPGPYNGTADESQALFDLDYENYTVMSYFNPYANGLGPQTPMVYDILAVQSIYGQDISTRKTNTTYGFNAKNLGDKVDIFDFSKNSYPILTIWDAGGKKDTLDLSGYSSDSIIDLRPGSYSSVNGMINNIGIAYFTDIEMAIGGSGADTIIGNSLDNTLRGKAGADILYGLEGMDTLFGGGGADWLYGDFHHSYYALSPELVDLGTGPISVINGLTLPVLSFFEDGAFAPPENEPGPFDLEEMDDAIQGGAGEDVLFGGQGDDTLGDLNTTDDIDGERGDDVLAGGSGDDLLLGGSGWDTLNGGPGEDILVGGEGGDTYFVFYGENDIIIEDGGDPNTDTIIFNFPEFDMNSVPNIERFDYVGIEKLDATVFADSGIDEIYVGNAGSEIQLKLNGAPNTGDVYPPFITCGAGQDEFILSWDEPTIWGWEFSQFDGSAGDKIDASAFNIRGVRDLFDNVDVEDAGTYLLYTYIPIEDDQGQEIVKTQFRIETYDGDNWTTQVGVNFDESCTVTPSDFVI